MAERPISWSKAMQRALYAEPGYAEQGYAEQGYAEPSGFYLTSGAPGRHFRTAAHSSPLWSEAIAELAERVDRNLGSPPAMTVVDFGAGGGELLSELAGLLPARFALVGVDLAPRPEHLDDRVAWQAQLPETITGLLIAVELLDVVAVDVLELTETGVVQVEVDQRGRQSLGAPADPSQLRWQETWWPLHEIGDRCEVGSSRDQVWADATGRVDRGAAVAIDYAAIPERDTSGTLTGFRNGRPCTPVPDGSCDLTAHVFFQSLQRKADLLMTQRDSLPRLGLDARAATAYQGEPRRYLESLSRAGAAFELMDPSGLGAFEWLIHPVGIDAPL